MQAQPTSREPSWLLVQGAALEQVFGQKIAQHFLGEAVRSSGHVSK